MILRSQDAMRVDLVGGKAAALAQLTSAGFDVPAFIVLPSGLFTMDDTGPRPADALADVLRHALIELGPGPFAVRSSGRSEDGAEHSHAGQFETALNVEAPDVLAAAARVWASGFGATVKAYRALTTGEGATPPAVIVQRMIPARAAGVAFSADPLSGRRDRVAISAVRGLADRLVAGEVDGEDWTVSTAGEASGPSSAQVLTASEARAVAALARRAEATFDCPQDIEWAFEGDKLWLLQSRPITTQLRPVPAADDALVVFDNSNIVESYPGLVTPLTYSFAAYAYARVYRAFLLLLGVPAGQVAAAQPVLDNLLARIDGRVYYNLGNWYRSLALLPGFTFNRGFMEGMMGLDEPLPEELTRTVAPPAQTLAGKARDAIRLGRVALGLAVQAARLRRTKRRFMARLDRALNSRLDLGKANLTQLAAEYRTIERDLLDRWDAPLINDFLCMIGFGASRALLERWAGDRGRAFHNEIMIGQGDIISAEPAQRIARMGALVRETGLGDALRAEGPAVLTRHARLGPEFDAYLGRFGDRCVAELKLENVTLTEDPAPLVAAILAAAARPDTASPDRPAPDYAAIFPGQRIRVWLVRGLCRWAAARVRDRENLRFERTRIFGQARRVFLAMGREFAARGALDRPEDVFYLTVPEVLGAVEGSALSQRLAPLAALRRAEMEDSATRPEPPQRLTARGPAFGVVATATTARPAPTGAERFGKGCSAGIVRARARVIRDPAVEALEPGEILVARNTDPGWIAVFANASAIVVERGSLLSHSAIVARELGIPCVVALQDATRWITTGEQIEVDGTSGRVRRTDA